MPFSMLQILKNHKSTQDSIPVGWMLPAYQPYVSGGQYWKTVAGWEGGYPGSHVWGWVGMHTPSGVPASLYTHPTPSCIPTPSGILAPWYAHPHLPPTCPKNGHGTRHAHTPHGQNDTPQ